MVVDLPGAVGPEEAVDLARGDLEVEAVEGPSTWPNVLISPETAMAGTIRQ